MRDLVIDKREGMIESVRYESVNDGVCSTNLHRQPAERVHQELRRPSNPISVGTIQRFHFPFSLDFTSFSLLPLTKTHPYQTHQNGRQSRYQRFRYVQRLFCLRCLLAVPVALSPLFPGTTSYLSMALLHVSFPSLSMHLHLRWHIDTLT